ncbi:MAG: UvrD-helicase domain-containing protein [Candidatus Omnitrophica bacterium]|nr:UvrD-helicase domain-containing protein [Candidatus Omnitrophota bacterium]
MNRPNVLIIEASAGSGKTFYLSQEYVHFLLSDPYSVNKIHSLLAITFTNKAVFEMKTRILEFLRCIALDTFENHTERKSLLSFLGNDITALQEKASRALDYIIRHYNFFQVQTIDSFINTLLAGCAFHLGLSPNFSIKTDIQEQILYAIDFLLEQARTDTNIQKIFQEFLRQYLILEDDPHWIAKQAIYRTLSWMLSAQNTYAGNFILESRNNFFEEKQKLFLLLKELNDNLPLECNKNFKKSLGRIIKNNPLSISVSDLGDFFTQDNVPLRKGYNPEQNLTNLWRKIKIQCKKLAELEATALFDCYIRLYQYFLNIFEEYNRRNNIVFLGELNRLANKLFSNGSLSVPELYIRLSCRFRHYLIDEFQDTSSLQWYNLYPLINDALASGGSLLYVGDKKQAIYRFRGGEVDLFDQVKKLFEHYQPLVKKHKINFRSAKEIVAFNNRLFSTENIRRIIRKIFSEERFIILKFDEEDEKQIVSFYADSAQQALETADTGYVNLTLIRGQDAEERKEQVRQLITQTIVDCSKRFEYRNIAVLARSNEDVQQYANWLIELNIPVQSEKTINIRKHPLIKEIISFLKFIKNPSDNLAFSSFITGKIFLSKANILSEKIYEFLFRLGSLDNYLSVKYYQIFMNEFPSIWNQLIAEFYSLGGYMPLYELVVSIFERFEILKSFSKFQGFFMRFIELIHLKEKEYPTISGFLDYLQIAPDEDCYVETSQTNAVNILTVHKAKGLGFQVVIVPEADIEIKVGGNLVYHDKDTLALVRLKKDSIIFSKQLSDLYRLEVKRTIIDQLNTLYVAFTRAEKELYIGLPVKKNEDYHYLIEEGNCYFGKLPDSPKTKISLKRDIEFLPSFSYKDWISLINEEFVFSQQEDVRTEEGERLHNILAKITYLTKENYLETVKKAVQSVLIKEALLQETEKYTEHILQLVMRTSWQEFFFVNCTVWCEQELITKDATTKRIDRLLIYPEKVIVIDFKSSPSKYQQQINQLKQYLEILKEIYPQKKVEGVLLFFDQDKTVRFYV